MTDAETADTADTATRFTLWHKPDHDHGGAWEAVAETRTEFEAVVLIGTGGRRNGKWLILEKGQQP